MKTALFRGQALKASSDVQFGAPIALMPWSWWALLAFFILFSVSTLTFLANATFPRKEAASGILRFSRGEIRVTAPKAGIVTAIYIKDGQTVVVGDLLAFISTEQRLINGDVFDARVIESINQERSMLTTRLVALNSSEPLQEASYRERITGIALQLNEYATDKVGRLKRLQISKDSLHDYEKLAAQGIYGAEFVRSRQQQVLEQSQSVIDLSAKMLALESQRTDLRLQLLRLPSDIAQSRSSILQSVASLEGRLADASAQNGFSLIARASGTVTSMQAQIGDPVDQSHPLMTIIPEGSILQVELYVPSRAAGFISSGQRVRLLYDAFPYTRFGPGFAIVKQISTAVLRPEEVSAAVKATEPVYRVVAALQDVTMMAYGKAMPLQSGMALSAEILLEDRSFLDLLLDPLRAAGGRILGT